MSRFDSACKTYGPAIVQRLLRDGTTQAVFELQTDPVFKEALQALAENKGLVNRLWSGAAPSDADMAYIRPLFAAFAQLADPTAGRKSAPWKYLDWACRAYLSEAQVRARLTEDIYKLRDDLKDYEAFGSQLSKDKRSIDAISDAFELSALLRPMQDARDQRKADEDRRRQNESQREQILDETSIIYDGPEGKVVMPHTELSCTYWGQQTKWCISANGRNAFDHYHKDAAIFIFMPKPTAEEKTILSDYKSFKFAGTKGTLYDERDHSRPGLPPSLVKLVEAATQKMSRPQKNEMLKASGLAAAKPLAPASGHWQEAQPLLAAVKHDKTAMLFASDRLRGDRDFALQAVRLNAAILPLLAPALLADAEIAKAALFRQESRKDWMKFNADALDQLSPALFADKRFVLSVLKRLVTEKDLYRDDKNSSVTALIGKTASMLWNDPDVALAFLQAAPQHGKVGPALKGDAAFMLSAVALRPQLFKEASDEVRASKAVALAAVAKDGRLLFHAASTLKADRDVVTAAVANALDALQEASPALREDPAVNLAWLVRSRGDNSSLPASLRKDPIFMTTAIAQNVAVLDIAEGELWANKSFTLAAIKAYDQKWDKEHKVIAALQHSAPGLFDDPDVALALAAKDPGLFQHVSERLKSDRKFLWEAAALNGKILQFAPEEIRADKGWMLAAVLRNWQALEFAARPIKLDREVALAAIGQNWEALKFVSRELRAERDIITAGLKQSKRALEYASGMLICDPTLVRQANLREAWGKVAGVSRSICQKVAKPFRRKGAAPALGA